MTAATDFFKDKKSRWTIWQAPNLLLYSWLVAKAVAFIIKNGLLHSLSDTLAFGLLFTWSWLELTGGASYFRRGLGLLVLIAVIKSRV